MKKKKEPPRLANVLRLFQHRIQEFEGDSRRSYQKAFASFQVYVVGHFPLNRDFAEDIVENWVIYNILQGYSKNTVLFYLEKISSLYSAIARFLVGGKDDIFKDVKRNLKDFEPSSKYTEQLMSISDKISRITKSNNLNDKASRLVNAILEFPEKEFTPSNPGLAKLWCSFALQAGINPDIVKGVVEERAGFLPDGLDFLKICKARKASSDSLDEIKNMIARRLEGEQPQWFAMRLRPKANFSLLMKRFDSLSGKIKLPEIFYPHEEIARKIGRKLVWKGRPVIHDVVFFKSLPTEIYPLFTQIYDVAWCYRIPGGGPGNYAPIPERAMSEFKQSLGLLTPDFEIAPAGEMKLKSGDEVVIIDGDYINLHAKILRKEISPVSQNKIFRVSLLNLNGNWNIGIDARLLKPIENP